MILTIWIAVALMACMASFVVGMQFGKMVSISKAYSHGYMDGAKYGTYK